MPKKYHQKYEFTDRQKEIINGCLLGDGCLTKLRKPHHNSKLTVSHGEKQLGLLQWLNNELKPASLEIRKRERKKSRFKIYKNTPEGEKTTVSYDFETFSHPYFTKLESAWYKRDAENNYILKQVGNVKTRIKQLPQDLKLTPLTIAQWAWDDANISAKYRQARFCSESFTQEENEYLINELKNFNINGFLDIENNKYCRIKIHSKSFIDLVDLIQEFTPPSMEYKTDLAEYRATSKYSNDTIREIAKLLNEKVPQAQIARQLNVPRHLVVTIKSGICWQAITGFEKTNSLIKNYNSKFEIKGVCQKDNKFCAYIYVRNQNLHLGSFATAEEAISVRKQADYLKSIGVIDKHKYKSIKPS